MIMKRSREEDREVEALAMANCLILLSRFGQTSTSTPFDRVYECKTCNRKFPSFQALGGHRASHKRPKLLMEGYDHNHNSPSLPAKPKTHECSICGVEFAIGQALGGHMRRHKSDRIKEGHKFIQTDAPVSVSVSVSLSVSVPVPVLKRSNTKRVTCLDLDLNLTPYENDLKLGYQMAPLFSNHFL